MFKPTNLVGSSTQNIPPLNRVTCINIVKEELKRYADNNRQI